MKHLTLIMAILVSISVSNVYGAKSTKLSAKTAPAQKKPEATREIAMERGIDTVDFRKFVRVFEAYILLQVYKDIKNENARKRLIKQLAL